jgi:hypothetical protein
MNKEEIIETIKKAFIAEKYPGDDKLVDKIIYPEEEEIVENFTGKLWYELKNDFLLNFRDNIYFLSKCALKYYIPAFMIATVKDFNKMDDIPDMIIGVFLLPEKEDIIKLYQNVKSFEPIEGITDTIDYNKCEKMALDFFERDRKIFYERMNEFNNEQCKAITLYLEYMKQYKNELWENNDPQIALDRYWNKIKME